jgi:hypothetical protein
MQIRGQLRANAVAVANVVGALDQYPECCAAHTCMSGYHGWDNPQTRVRFKARSQSHGNATGQSKGGQGK